MDNVTLSSLLESDREMILASLNRDRSPQAAQTALEKALDRVSLRYAEQCPDAVPERFLEILLEPLEGDARRITLREQGEFPRVELPGEADEMNRGEAEA